MKKDFSFLDCLGLMSSLFAELELTREEALAVVETFKHDLLDEAVDNFRCLCADSKKVRIKKKKVANNRLCSSCGGG
jgi:hypothetical protein